MYLYRAVFRLYVGDYEGSKIDFDLSWNHHLQIKKQAMQESAKSTKNAGKKKIGIDTDMEDEMYGKYPAS